MLLCNFYFFSGRKKFIKWCDKTIQRIQNAIFPPTRYLPIPSIAQGKGSVLSCAKGYNFATITRVSEYKNINSKNRYFYVEFDLGNDFE